MSALRGAGRRTGMTTNQSSQSRRPVAPVFTLRRYRADTVNIPVADGPTLTARLLNAQQNLYRIVFPPREIETFNYTIFR